MLCLRVILEDVLWAERRDFEKNVKEKALVSAVAQFIIFSQALFMHVSDLSFLPIELCTTVYEHLPCLSGNHDPSFLQKCIRKKQLEIKKTQAYVSADKKTTIYILLAKIMLYLIFALQKIFGPHYL